MAESKLAVVVQTAPQNFPLGSRQTPVSESFGGEGGEGSSAEKLQRGVRRARTPPQGGERKRLKLTLKVVADVSIVCYFVYRI